MLFAKATNDSLHPREIKKTPGCIPSANESYTTPSRREKGDN
jgi:hypothetical protein